MEPQAVMKCPKCRFGMVYRYGDTLECERCNFTQISANGVPPPNKNDPPQRYADGP